MPGMSTSRPPHTVKDFEQRYPQVWEAFQQLGQECHDHGGPLDERTRRLIKLALAIGTRHEGATHSAVRQALASGIGKDELLHVAILAITTVGWPSAYAAMTWIEDSE